MPICLYACTDFLLIDSFAYTVGDEGRKRQRFTCALFVFVQEFASLCHTDFDQAMHHGFVYSSLYNAPIIAIPSCASNFRELRDIGGLSPCMAALCV